MLDSLQGNDRGCDLGSVVAWGNTWELLRLLGLRGRRDLETDTERGVYRQYNNTERLGN